MPKISRPPRGPEAGASWPLFFPFSPAMLSFRGRDGTTGILPAIAECALSRSPLTIGVGICRRSYNEDYWERFTYHLAMESLEFVCNIPSADIADKVNATGAVSGHRVKDKFAHAGLTPLPARVVSAPLIAECSVNLECVVRHILNVGSHDLFMGEVVMIHIDEAVEKGEKRPAWRDLPEVVPGEETP
ncbi:MAG: flavin reductase family protein [Armatimonadetes bacterium]|nr:flavin reductase family protein [Armatimonadota bacterium]